MPICICICIASGAAARANERNDAPFVEQTITNHDFQKIKIWAPPPGSVGRFATFILLHGNEPSSPDPTWLVGLHWQPNFARSILIVPSLLDGGYDFGAPKTARAIATLMEDIARRFPVDRSAIYLVGYSAGASRVLAVARELPRLRGIVAVAGDIARPIRDGNLAPEPLTSVPILLVCMADDAGAHTSCKLNDANRVLLAQRGFSRVTLERLPGAHQLDLAMLAPLIGRWASPNF